MKNVFNDLKNVMMQEWTFFICVGKKVHLLKSKLSKKAKQRQANIKKKNVRFWS